MLKLKKILEYLLYLFVFLLPLQTRFIYQEFLIKVQPFEYGRLSIYATELLLGLTIVLGLVFILMKFKSEKLKISFHKSKLRMILLIIGLISLGINILLATSHELSFYKATQIILAFCFFFLLLIIKPDFKRLSWVFIYSALIQSVLALQQFTAQKVVANKWLGMASQDPNVLGTPVVLTNAGRWLRSFGGLPHPNILAGFLVVALILILFLSLRDEIKTSKRNLNLSFVIIFLGLLTTLSKAAILCAIIIFTLALFFTRRDNEPNKKISRLAIVALAVLVFFTVSYPALVFNRVTNANAVEQRSYSERVSQYGEWAQVMKSNLFFGTGIGNYALDLQKVKPNLESWDYQPMHNTFLLIVAEIGIIPFLYIIGLCIYFARRNKWQIDLFNLSHLPLVSLVLLMLVDHYWWSFYSGLMLMGFVGAVIFLARDSSAK
ncbi:MAG: O-antigen ligase-related protein [Parcubacteria group bacterium GW2011_GWC2_39_14]|nr:MAG: O-antigen ligase-related protein [Parcubacteria group bacterium GW2011_GWC2_39_14]KKR53679.1 MAG: O-antigen ligase-related protein [Parcubacteria group bacterium GW2011_GWA2_40_23]